MDEDGKHLIFLVDGTWNSAANGKYSDLTNIFKLNVAINTIDNDGRHQIVFYIPGPGNRGVIDRGLGGLFGQGIDQIIRELYINIASNYWEGDKIYLMGYSRGAVVCRAITSMISKCGLLRAEHIDRLWAVWQYFLSDATDNRFYESKIKEYIRDDVKIDFVGLFDTVIGRNYKDSNHFSRLRFQDKKVESCIKRGTHILSMNDDRRVFTPILWDAQDNDDQVVEQIWIPGVHSDIGGNGDGDFISDVALLTMIERIQTHTIIGMDDDVVDRYLESIDNHKRITVTNERKSASMKLIRFSRRSIGNTEINEQIHPLYDLICDESIYYKGKYQVYKPLIKKDHSDGLNRYQTRYLDHFRKNVRRINNIRPA